MKPVGLGLAVKKTLFRPHCQPPFRQWQSVRVRPVKTGSHHRPPKVLEQPEAQVRFPPRKLLDTLSEHSSSVSVLAHPLLVVNRQLEMLNVFLGKYKRVPF